MSKVTLENILHVICTYVSIVLIKSFFFNKIYYKLLCNGSE